LLVNLIPTDPDLLQSRYQCAGAQCRNARAHLVPPSQGGLPRRPTAHPGAPTKQPRGRRRFARSKSGCRGLESDLMQRNGFPHQPPI